MRAAIVLVIVGVSSLAFPLFAQGTKLGVEGAQFTLNDKPTFLLGFSYYGALGASEDTLKRDLDDAGRCGFNWLRVWVTWESFGRDVSAVDSTGAARQPFMDRLKWLVAECDRRGMVLDLTFTRGASPLEAAAPGRLSNRESHRQAVKTLVSEFKPWRNWYLDLSNEHDVGDSRHVSMQEIGELRTLVRELDRDRLVTASFGGRDLDEQDLRSALVTGKLNFIAPHRPRNAESPRQTEEVTRRMLERIKQLGYVVPVLYQEPFRRGYAEWEPTVDDFLTDLQGAIAGGAAGWCFHNGKQGDAPDGQPRRSFDLSARRLFDQFDEQERQLLERLPQVHAGTDKPADQDGPADTDELRNVSVLRTGPQAGHYLQWRGKPLMLIGDSVTQGWMECGANFDQDAYLDALAKRKVNLVMLWAFKGTNAAMQQADKRIGYDAPELWPWYGSPDDASFDLRRFNPSYFARLRSFVARAESKGLIVLITVHDGWTKTCFAGHPFNRELGNGPLNDRRQYVELADYEHEMPEDFEPSWSWQQRNQYFQERFCAALIQELDAYSNVMYEMFNEGEWYDKTQRRLHELHFLAFFRQRCSNLLLSNADHLARLRPHDDTRLDVVTLHPQGWTGQTAKFCLGFRTLPAKPYLCSEPVPEFNGREPSLATVRQSVWEIALAGAGWVNQNDLSFGWDSRAAASRDAAMRDTAYDVAGHCARFFDRYGINFSELAPAPELASTGCCLARPGEDYVVYSPAPSEFSVDLSAATGGVFQTRWYDPQTGDFCDAPDTLGGDRRTPFRSPLSADSVLYLVRSVAAHHASAARPQPSLCSTNLRDAMTRVSIQQGRWQINGPYTNPGSAAEGLLMNVRMVPATLDVRACGL